MIGDKVCIGGDDGGVVVCDIDAGRFSLSYPEVEWAYLNNGVLIEFPTFGVIHMKNPDADLELIARVK